MSALRISALCVLAAALLAVTACEKHDPSEHEDHAHTNEPHAPDEEHGDDEHAGHEHDDEHDDEHGNDDGDHANAEEGDAEHADEHGEDHADEHGEEGTANEPPTNPRSAIAQVRPTDGNEAAGWVRFDEVAGGVRVSAEISGLTPGNHGFHIHQWGDCSAANGTSAGGHFNPSGHDHGGPDAEVRHAGDLGNIEAGADGLARYDRIDAALTFDGDASLIGRGLIVHAGEDDLNSQPTGAAGARVGCAVIGVAAPPE